MPTEISQRCRAISPSATLTVDAKAQALRAEGIDVIGFAAGEPDFDTPKVVRDAFKEALEGYTAKFIEAVEDDLNTADGISALFEMAREINSFLEEK